MRRCVSRHVMSAVAAEAVGPPRILPAVTTQVGRKALQDSYNQNGFAIPKFSLPGDQIAALTRSLEKIQQENPKMEPEKIINAHLYNMGEGQANPFLELGRDPALLDIVAAALNTENVILWAGQIFCKPPGTGRTVPWHQDGQYWPIVPLRAVTAWVALDKSIRSNGCLQVLPGSHTKLHPHVQKLAADAAIDFILDEALFASGQLNED